MLPETLLTIGLLQASALAADPAPVLREAASGIEFIALPGGCYTMGTPDDAYRDDDTSLHNRAKRTEMPAHEVCVSPFAIARTEVTRKQWEALMPSLEEPTGDGNLPKAAVTRAQAEAFARRLTERGKDGAEYRLPSEAEWEYACRANTPSNYVRVPWTSDLDPLAWYDSAYDGHPADRLHDLQPVATRAPNAFGLHDMLGNVWEWVADDYLEAAYASHALHDPKTVTGSGVGTIRGGGLRSDRRIVRCETRGWLPVDEPTDTTGFRLVRIAPKD